jgi:hypothetical protein
MMTLDDILHPWEDYGRQLNLKWAIERSLLQKNSFSTQTVHFIWISISFLLYSKQPLEVQDGIFQKTKMNIKAKYQTLKHRFVLEQQDKNKIPTPP